MRYIWNGYEYDNGDTWASPLVEFKACVENFDPAIRYDQARIIELVRAQGCAVERVTLVDDLGAGECLAIILPASSDRAAMSREFHTLIEAVQKELSE